MQDLFSDIDTIHNRPWTYLHHTELGAATSTKDRHDICVWVNNQHHASITNRGFKINVTVESNILSWDCGTEGIAAEDPLYLTDTTGFLLRVSLVVGTTVFDGFLVPSLSSRNHELTFSTSKCLTFAPNDCVDEWYKQLDTMVPTGTTTTKAPVKGERAIVLVKKASAGITNLRRIAHGDDIVHGAFYERLNITF